MAAKNSRDYWQRVKLDPVKLAEARAKNAEKARKFRDKKRQTLEPEIVLQTSTFSTVQQKGRYIKKTKAALPYATEQRDEILINILSETTFKDKPLKVPVKCCHVSEIQPDTIKKINEFYCSDEISRMSPNVKDFIMMGNSEKKTKVQVRHLQLSIKETYEAFKILYPDETIGLSKFKELRPANVRSVTKTPHNVCCCLIHENMRYALEAISNVHRNIRQTLILGRDMHKNFVCDPVTESCYSNDCDDCKDGKVFLKSIDDLSPWKPS